MHALLEAVGKPELRYSLDATAATSLLASGKVDEAMVATSDSLAASKAIIEDAARFKALSEVAALLAALGEFKRAREIAEECGSATDRVTAFASIVRAYADRRRGKRRAVTSVAAGRIAAPPDIPRLPPFDEIEP